MLQIHEPKVLGVYVSGTTFERLEAMAKEQQRTKSQVARLILERALAKEAKKA